MVVYGPLHHPGRAIPPASPLTFNTDDTAIDGSNSPQSAEEFSKILAEGSAHSKNASFPALPTDQKPALDTPSAALSSSVFPGMTSRTHSASELPKAEHRQLVPNYCSLFLGTGRWVRAGTRQSQSPQRQHQASSSKSAPAGHVQAVGSPRPINGPPPCRCAGTPAPQSPRNPELCSCCPHRVKQRPIMCQALF